MITRAWNWTRQPMSAATHALGAVFGVFALAWLLVVVGTEASWPRLAAVLVFGITMITLFASSAIYHALPLGAVGVARLRKLDHSSIYVFIAGSYTPFCLLLLWEGKGPWVLALVWAAAMIGVAIKLLWMESSRWLRVGPYLALSWISVLLLPDIFQRLPPGGMFWLVAEGAFYTVGSVVYATKKPDPLPEVFGFHEIWHLFVMGGAFSHFWLVKQYLLSTAG